MLTEICQYLRNWFERDKLIGDFVISGGVLTHADGSTLNLLNGQYIRIVGSVLNDGVHQWGSSLLTDESFTGAVWSMAVPPTVIQLAEDIKDWCSANTAAINSPYQSESFGGYSYSMRSGSGADGYDGAGWESQFKSRLSPWRKI